MNNFDDVEIKEYEVGPIKIAFIRGGFSSDNPKAYMDCVVSEYVKGCSYNQFIEEHLDDPWLRVIITGINDIPFEPFNDQRLKK